MDTRKLIYFGITIAAGLLLILLPAALARTIFVVLLVGTVGATGWQFLQQADISSQFGWLKRYRMHLSLFSVSAALSMMILCANEFSRNNTYEEFEQTVTVAALGVLVLGVAAWWSPVPLPVPPQGHDLLPEKSSWGLFAAGALVMLALAEINGQMLDVLPVVSIHLQFLMLVMGILLLVMGAGKVSLTLRPPLPSRERGNESPFMGKGFGVGVWQEIGLVLVITLLALFLRGYRAGDWVRGMIDEGHFLAGVNDITFNDKTLLLAQAGPTRAFTILHSYWQYLSAEVFGRELFALRIVSGIIGALTVPALYLLARELFNKQTALVAAVLLAAFPPHVHYSRIGINGVSDPLFGTLALAFLARGLRTHRRLDFALSGAALGLTQYFYEGGRLFYPLLMAGWLVVLVVVWRPPFKGLLLMVVIGLLIGLPFYYTVEGRQNSVTWRLDQVSLTREEWLNQLEVFLKPDTPPVITYNFTAPFMFLVQIRDNSLFYGGEEPLLLIFAVPFFLMGIGFAVWQFWKPAMILVLAWAFFGTFGNTIMHEVVSFPRYLPVLPALVLLTAIGITSTLALLPFKWQWALVSLLLISITLAQVDYYFYVHAPLLVEQSRQDSDADDDAVFRAADLPPGTLAVIFTERPFSSFDLSAVIAYLEFHPSIYVIGFTDKNINPAWLGTLPSDRSLALFVDADNQEARRIIETYYDVHEAELSPYNIPRKNQMAMYFVPR